MKLLELIRKVGVDRCAHLGIGGLMCAMITEILTPLTGTAARPSERRKI